MTKPLFLPFGGHVPSVHQGAWVAPQTVLVGNVTVDDNCSIWYGSVVRAEFAMVHIQAGSNLQDNVVVHVDEGCPLVVETDVSVGHGAVLHGCRIGARSVIGMNATILNDAVIGEDCIVAAGAVVLSGTVIEQGSLVAGVPAKIRRSLSDSEMAFSLEQSRAYVTLAREHRDGLRQSQH